MYSVLFVLACYLQFGVLNSSRISIDPNSKFFVDEDNRVRIFHGVNVGNSFDKQC